MCVIQPHLLLIESHHGLLFVSVTKLDENSTAAAFHCAAAVWKQSDGWWSLIFSHHLTRPLIKSFILNINQYWLERTPTFSLPLFSVTPVYVCIYHQSSLSPVKTLSGWLSVFIVCPRRQVIVLLQLLPRCSGLDPHSPNCWLDVIFHSLIDNISEFLTKGGWCRCA